MVKLFFGNRKRFDFLIKELDGYREDKEKGTSKAEVHTRTNGVIQRYFETHPRDLLVDPTGDSRIRVGRVPREGVCV